MAYITLEELKEHLPVILSDWIEPGDEGWEWIFQEIEQKCHVGKCLKGKKWKKKLVSMVDTHSTVLSAHRNDINELNKKIDKLNEEAERVHKDLSNIKRITLKDLSNRIEQVRSMAQTAKQRTEVDYTKCSKKDDKEIWNPIEGCHTCKYISLQPLDKPCVGCCYNGMNISGTNKWEAKENE